MSSQLPTEKNQTTTTTTKKQKRQKKQKKKTKNKKKGSKVKFYRLESSCTKTYVQ